MKKIEATIRPSKFDEVMESLIEAGAIGMTVSEVHGYGQQKERFELYRGVKYATEFQPRLKLEILVEDEICSEMIEHLILAAQTGAIGDGKIVVSPSERLLRIRTGEVNQEAL